MWVIYAFGSALFAGITAILAKIGVKNTDSNVATAIRTIVILIFSWIMVFLVGAQNTLGNISGRTLLFLVLSGIATGLSWLCYFRALQYGDVNKVAPIDKSSTVLTMILAFIILGEGITILKLAAMAAIGIGTWLMIAKKPVEAKEEKSSKGNAWLIYAIFSAIFASLTSILGKIGIQNIDSNLGTAIRTIVVLIMAWIVVGASGKIKEITRTDKKSLGFICFSGITTGLSWLCYYRALQDGQASIVVPIDKLSILVTIIFSRLFLKEKLTRKALVGLCLLVMGTLLLLV